MKAAAGKGQEGQSAAAPGFGEAVDWCSQVTALMAALSGIRLLRIEEDELVVGLTTYAGSSPDNDASGALHSPGIK